MGEIILVASRKGGTGKTTILCSTAVALAKKGFDVAILDADPMGSSSIWYEKRLEAEYDGEIELFRDSGDLQPILKKIVRSKDKVLVDVAGNDSVELRSGLLAADKVLLPLKCSSVDERTLEYLSEVVKEAKKRNKKLKVYSVLSIVDDYDTRKDLSALKRLLTKYGMKPLPAAIKNRAVYKDAMKEGMGVHESSIGPAKREIGVITKEFSK